MNHLRCLPLFLLLTTTVLGYSITGKVVRVIDGDTIEVFDGEGERRV